MTAQNKKYLIYGGVAILVGSLGYYAYNSFTTKAPAQDDNQLPTPTPEPAPAPRVNPFTALLGKTFPSINFKPTQYTYTNPFADVNTAIANVNPLSSSNPSERIV